MLFLVTGASGSGKSEYAEQLACNLAKRDGLQKKIYVATMERIGEEAERRITRHRKLRAGKGFVTAEAPFGLSGIKSYLPGMKEADLGEAVVLLECLSNLLANLMISRGLDGEEAGKEIRRQIETGRTYYRHLIVVTNEVFSDGVIGADTVRSYVQALGTVNRHLATLADVFCEVVYTIPAFLKGESLCQF